MKPGDLVRTKTRYEILWREASSPQGHKDFYVQHTELMLVAEGPWTEKWSKPETGERSDTFVRVLHPVHGLIRGSIRCLEVVNESR